MTSALLHMLFPYFNFAHLVGIEISFLIYKNKTFMIPLYSNDEFNSAKTTDKLPVKCIICDKTFYKLKRVIQRIKYEYLSYTSNYCSSECQGVDMYKSIKINCTNCQIEVIKQPSQLKSVKNPFCSQSCAATYNNLHKTHGTRRSKLEIWLEQKLIQLYPKLNILYCDKTAINSELDIYIPSLNIAFELNGIYHYEPIHGQNKLNQVQNNDNRKFQACLENNIELVIIDTSSLKYYKEQNCIKYLDIISKIINIKLNLANH